MGKKFTLPSIFTDGLDAFLRMFLPKLVTAAINIFRGGFRIIYRATIELLRANFFTRIISCSTIFMLDIIDLCRRRISKMQFIKNVLNTAVMIISGTIGWNIGSGYFDIIGGIIGAGVIGFLASCLCSVILNRFIDDDSIQMRMIIKKYATDTDIDLLKINSSTLKKMYASKDRDAFAQELVWGRAGEKHSGGII